MGVCPTGICLVGRRSKRWYQTGGFPLGGMLWEAHKDTDENSLDENETIRYIVH